MFSDRAGTTPVTAPGTVVGLRLDKSKGLAMGSQLANQDFTTYVNYAPLPFDTLPATGSSLTLANATSKTTIASSPDTISVVSGKSYLIAYAASVASGGFTATIRNAAAGTSYATGPQITASGTFSFVFTATVTENVVFQITATAGIANYTFSNISVRELAGNHAVAPTDAARPIYGVEPKGGRRNLLTWSEDFRDTAAAGETRPWTYTNATIPTTNNIAPDGTATADKLAETSASGKHRTYQVFGLTGITYTFTCYLKAAERTWAYLNFGDIIDRQTWFNLSTGAVGTVGSGVTASIVSAGNGWYRCSISKTSVSNNPNFDVGIANADNSFSYAGVTGNGIYAWGAQLELGSTATAYQRVTTAYDVTESGVATCHYVQYDGSDDSMSTAAIDFTATDKMSVFAGVRKSGNDGIMVELGPDVNNNAGSFAMYPGAYGVAGSEYAFISGGTNRRSIDYEAGLSVPYYGLMTGLGDISGDINRLRVNGTQVAQSTADQGTGNFGSYPLFIGRRNNASLSFNGRDYGIIVVGKLASAGEITDTETWLAARTSGVSL